MTELKKLLNEPVALAPVKRSSHLSVSRDYESERCKVDVIGKNGEPMGRLEVWDSGDGGRITIFDEFGARLIADLNWDEMDVLTLAIIGTRAGL
jgi:hypothetical protein